MNGQAVEQAYKNVYEELIQCDEFEEFFICVSKKKVSLNIEELKILKNVVMDFRYKYNIEALIYLCDSITAEMTLPINAKGPIRDKESKYRERIVKNFNIIFPEYSFVKTEKEITGIGRIDIFAKDKASKRDVIIELKVDGKNPARQLLDYATAFHNPILIGISEREIDEKRRREGISYYTYKQLWSKIAENEVEIT